MFKIVYFVSSSLLFQASSNKTPSPSRGSSSFEEIDIPQSKWLCFRIFSQDPLEIQEMSQRFYKEFLPSCKYNLKELPELEYYHDDVTDFLVAIY